MKNWSDANLSLNFEGAAICPNTGDLYLCTDNGGGGDTLLVRFPPVNSEAQSAAPPLARKERRPSGPPSGLYEISMSTEQLKKWPYGTALVKLSLDPHDQHYDEASLHINGRKVGKTGHLIPVSLAGPTGVCRLKAGAHFQSFTVEPDKIYTWHFRLNEFEIDDYVAQGN